MNFSGDSEDRAGSGIRQNGFARIVNIPIRKQSALLTCLVLTIVFSVTLPYVEANTGEWIFSDVNAVKDRLGWVVGRAPGKAGDQLAPKQMARVALLVFLGCALLNVLERIVLEWKVPDTSSKQAVIEERIEHLKREAAKLNSPETFAASAKADRKAIGLEKELARMRHQEIVAKSHVMMRLPHLMRLAGFVMIVLLALVYKFRVVAYLEPGYLWPLGRWLSFMSGHPSSSGVVGMVPWSVLCHRVTNALVAR
eukprot:jgi/Picsp_1/4934/NSC_02298-R1_hypothetical protein CHLNCDRAFT_142812 [Chlorella variabilis]